MKSTENRVLSRIYGKKRGWVFAPGHFRDLGPDTSVRKALQNLCNRGTVRRLARGLYDYPKTHPELGTLSPTPDQIAQALAGKDKIRIQPSGAHAANLLGLSTQVPAKVEFLTDGANRTIMVGSRHITLKRTTPKSMAAAGRTSGLVIQALRHLGQQHVDDKVIAKLRHTLNDEDRRALMQDISLAPAWIGDIFRKLATEN